MASTETISSKTKNTKRKNLSGETKTTIGVGEIKS